MIDGVFQDAAVRDLAWVIRSPVLLNADYYADGTSYNAGKTAQHRYAEILDDKFCVQLYGEHYAWLLQQDQSPQRLHNWLAQRKSHRLGYYFEHLVEYWLRHLVGEGYFAAHVPVRRGKQTLGEFDFLFAQPGANELQHWEVAVKFYLAHRHEDDSILFYGPQARDRLDLKVTRMLEHQTTLAQTHEGQSAIGRASAPAIYSGVSSQVLLKGYLFYPSESDWRSAPLDGDGISPAHLRGWWTRIDALQIPAASPASRWYRVPRLSWLAPVVISDGQAQGLVVRETLTNFCRTQFTQRAEPFLLAEVAKSADGSWREISRGFVVSGVWPHTEVIE